MTTPEPAQGIEPLYTVPEAAEQCRLSIPTMRRHIAAGTVETVKLGGKRLVALSALERFVASGGDAA